MAVPQEGTRGEATGRRWTHRARPMMGQARDRLAVAARTRFFLPVLLAVIALALYTPRLTMPEKYLFDEIMFAYTAGEYTEGNGDAWQWDHPCSETRGAERCGELYPNHIKADGRIGRFQWAHPPLGKLVMSVGILLFGNDAFGWRVMSVVVGTTGVAIAYGLGLHLTGRRAVGALTGGFLLLDGMYLVYSRMGLVDIYLTVFIMAAMLAFAWYLRSPPERTRAPLLITGLLIGLSIATKWSAVYGAVFIGLMILLRNVQVWRASQQPGASPELRGAAWQHLVLVPVALGLVPLGVYLLTYMPFFLAGYDMEQFIELQREILTFHANLQGTPPHASSWWTWPLDWRSVWFGTRSYADGRIASTFALGNPLLYWAFVPAAVWTLVRWWRSYHSVGSVVLLIGFFGQWLPWALVDRHTYLYHFLPAVPFGCLAVAVTVVHITDTWRDWRRTLAIQYMVLVTLAFVFFYPIVAYFPLTEHWYDLRFWLPSWKL